LAIDIRVRAGYKEKNIHLYHIAYSPESLALKEDGYLLLDHLKNERSDWREYWPIRKFFLENVLEEESLYGFFSPRFKEKIGLSHQDVMSFIQKARPDAEVVTFCPQPDIGAFFMNMFEGGDIFNPGFMAINQKFYNHIGFPVKLIELLMDSRNIIFSNYFVAKPRFWQNWLNVTEALFECAEGLRPCDFQAELTDATIYPGAVERKVFMVENVASVLLCTQQWKVVNHNPFGGSWSAMLGHLREEAILSDALKIAFASTGFHEFLDEYSKIRLKVFPKR
jgi:hypothetical protein